MDNSIAPKYLPLQSMETYITVITNNIITKRITQEPRFSMGHLQCLYILTCTGGITAITPCYNRGMRQHCEWQNDC